VPVALFVVVIVQWTVAVAPVAAVRLARSGDLAIVQMEV